MQTSISMYMLISSQHFNELFLYTIYQIAMTEEVVILINDCLGTKLPGKLGRLIPRLSNPRPHNVLRGELLVPLKNKHSSQNDGPPQPNYFVKMDPNIILYCKAEEVSPLDRRESRFLEGIESTYQRHALFIEGTKTEWGLTLVVSDTVYASIPGPNPVVRKCATANIRYIGEVKGLSGYQFGIEILVRLYVHKCTFIVISLFKITSY